MSVVSRNSYISTSNNSSRFLESLWKIGSFNIFGIKKFITTATSTTNDVYITGDLYVDGTIKVGRTSSNIEGRLIYLETQNQILQNRITVLESYIQNNLYVTS